jgi:hypothetical protein
MMSSWPLLTFDLMAGACPSFGSSSILAYLDPGMGSYAFQILLASLFGAMFALRQSWYGVKAWITNRFGSATGQFDPSTLDRSNGIRPKTIMRPRIDGQSTAEIP